MFRDAGSKCTIFDKVSWQHNKQLGVGERSAKAKPIRWEMQNATVQLLLQNAIPRKS